MATKIDLAKIDKKVTALSDALAKLGKGTDLKELIRLSRQPGWTTPAEYAFAMSILDSMQRQVDQLAQLSGALIKAAGKVSAKR
ncbi:MAG TPA: hypothetical protein VGM81_14490 [Burkholderiaceae bacterium]|jgi:hypothetical protein